MAHLCQPVRWLRTDEARATQEPAATAPGTPVAQEIAWTAYLMWLAHGAAPPQAGADPSIYHRWAETQVLERRHRSSAPPHSS